MRIRNLLYLLFALPLLFVACEKNAPVDEIKDATISVTTGTTSPSSVAFTITSTDADKVAYVVVEASEAAPNASEVLATGTAVEANTSVEVKESNLMPNTEYTIVAAAQNKKGVVKTTASMKTNQGASHEWELTSEDEVEFSAEGGEGMITYNYTLHEDVGEDGPLADRETNVEIACDAAWVEVEATLPVDQDIPFTVAANDGEAREATIVVKYMSETVFEVKVKQAAKQNDTPVDGDVNFTASVYEVYYYGTQYSAAYNYQVFLSDNGLNENGNFKQDGIYYMLDIYAADSAENNHFTLPNGKYTASETPNAGTFGIGDYGARIEIVGGVPTYSLYKQGTVTVTDGKIEAKIMMEDGTIHNVVFEGNLRFDGKEPENPDNPDNPDDPDQPLEATHIADKWLWGGSSSYGNKYQVSGDGFSLDVHFPAKYASEAALAEGEYIWTNTSWWGYNDFENEFTTRTFLVDGAYTSIIKEGTALVALEGDVYDITLTLKAEDGTTYIVKYNGKFADHSQGGGDEELGNEVVFTKIESLGYNSSYYFYEFKLTNDAGDSMQLCVNDYQAKDGYIYTDDSFEWISISYCGNLGYFSTRNIVVGGTSYTATSGSMAVVTDEDTYDMDITITLLMTAGGSKTFKFSGKVGGNEGGDAPAEPTKLETPSVSGLVSGNAATISWQAVAGAKDYSVSLDGTYVDTVETAYIVLSDLAYSTTYSVSVVANPADTTTHTASDAGTASFTTEADPNGGEEPENPGDGGDTTESFENWTFTASLDMATPALTLTDGSHTLVCTLNEMAAGTFYFSGDGALNVTNVTVNGVTAESASGTVSISTNDNYHVVINAEINGVKYTGTSTNAVV
ncbi:MAG: BACON domain-containing protein [Alistipes sp.]|nr:BACON domain-containing protein [Alistipes sp.]